MNASECFIVGVEGASLSPKERRLFADYPPGGVILFSRNIESESQLQSLISEISRSVPGVFFCVDQEGGPVDRFRQLAGESISFARAARLEVTLEAGRLAGELCAAFDIALDLAPVVDRAVPGAGGNVLKERCASSDPEEIVTAARSFCAGLSQFGVASCVKHFPGLGRGVVDSHLRLPRIAGDPRERESDLRPFVELAGETSTVMISHAAVGGSMLPATLDRAVATTALREEAGFGGAAISDDLEMGAVSGFGTLSQRAAAALAAGCDFLCLGTENSILPDACAEIAGGVPPERILEARARRAKLQEWFNRAKTLPRARPRPLPEIAADIARLRASGESAAL